MTTKARKSERKTRAAELDMEIMRAREANGLPVISPMLGLPPEKWECEFRDYLVALGDSRVADPEWLAARIREERRRARWFEKWFDAWFEESADGFRFEAKGCVHAAVGSAGCLIPPYEYHVLANALDRPSITLHIYGGEMTSCHIFEPIGEGRYVRHERALCYHD